MKIKRIVLLVAILIALSGCGNSSLNGKQNNNEQVTEDMVEARVEDSMSSELLRNDDSNYTGGKIKIIDTWHHYKETDEVTLKKHEDAVNSFISDKIIIDIDYSKNYFIRNTDYKDADYFDEIYGYSTQIYYKDK